MADNGLGAIERCVTAFNPNECRSNRQTFIENGKDVGYESISGRNQPWEFRGSPPPSGNRFRTADEGDE